ncbi:hypothetical protein Hte_007330 [Hypoxylon texense]
MATTKDEAQALLEKIEAVINSPREVLDLQDDSLRRRLREAGRRLSLSMEASGDTVHRISNTPLQLALARVGVETQLFQALVDTNGRVFTNTELAHRTNVEPALMSRYWDTDVLATG